MLAECQECRTIFERISVRIKICETCTQEQPSEEEEEES